MNADLDRRARELAQLDARDPRYAEGLEAWIMDMARQVRAEALEQAAAEIEATTDVDPATRMLLAFAVRGLKGEGNGR